VRRGNTFILVVAGLAGLLTIVLWTSGSSVLGAACGSALAPASFDTATGNTRADIAAEVDEANCAARVADRRWLAAGTSAIALLYAYVGFGTTPPRPEPPTHRWSMDPDLAEWSRSVL
jgi:hypothetical protein